MTAQLRDDALDELVEFIAAVHGDTPGFLPVPFGSGGHFDANEKYKHDSFSESWFELPAEADRAAHEIIRAATQGDVYIGTCLMTQPRRAKDTAASRHTIHVDVDGGLDLDKVREIGGFAVGSGSQGHGHVYVPVSENLTPAEFAMLSRAAQKYFGAKDAKIADNDILRPPGSLNYKSAARGGEPTPVVWLVHPSGERVDKYALAAALCVDLALAASTTSNGAEPVDLAAHPPVTAALAIVTGDRSIDIMRVVGVCVDDHLTLAQTRWVINTRPDLAGKIKQQGDRDDVAICFIKAIDDRQSRAADEDLVFGSAGQTTDGGQHQAGGDQQHQRQTGGGRHADDDGGGNTPRKSVATQLVELARDRYILGVTDTDDPYAAGLDVPHIALMLRGGRTGLRTELYRRYFQTRKTVASQQALADALGVLEGYAAQSNPRRVYLRVADCADDIYIDMGDVGGQVIRIHSGTWTIADTAPVLFRRTKLTGVMPQPVHGGDLSQLWRFVPVEETDRPLVLAWLVQALIQVDVSHPVLALLAEHGSIKSASTRCLALLADPSSVPLRKVPRNAEDWVTAANASWVVALDNLSGVIPLWLSDCLCRAVTGDGDVRRALYTDQDVSVISFRRAVIINGIDIQITQGDLADRLLRVDLPRVNGYLQESQVAADWGMAWPHILGGLLDLAAAVHRRLPSVTSVDLPRMADYAKVLTAVDEILRTRGSDRYREQAKQVAADTLDHPFIAELADRGLSFTDATSAEILAAIKPADYGWKPPRDWPARARAATAQLTRHAPALRAQGWTVDNDGGRNHRNALQWTIRPPLEPERGCNPHSHSSHDSQGRIRPDQAT
jgi:hypothetical protein